MNNLIFNNCKTYLNGKFSIKNLHIKNNKIVKISNKKIVDKTAKIYDCKGLVAIPGLIDIHTHLREPGYEYKEDINSGTKAAAAGGYTTICCMPNLNPPTDSTKNAKALLNLIKKNALVNVYPYGTITKGRKYGSEISDIKNLSKYVFAFSNDGCGVETSALMDKAMKEAKKVNKPIIAHSEDLSLIPLGGSVHEGINTKRYNLVGIPSSSEYKQVERDCKLAIKNKCQYHVCHVSCKETLDIIKKAKKLNPKISCEVTHHHLLLNENDVKNNGRFKMNPPLRTKKDQQALINGIKSGLIEIIVTDHAPHSKQEKNKGLAKSAFGITALDYSFPLLYTKLVKSKVISLDKLIKLMAINPSKMFKLPSTELKVNNPANILIFNPSLKDKINPKKFFSKGHSTPFENVLCYGWPIYTICNGKIVYERKR